MMTDLAPAGGRSVGSRTAPDPPLARSIGQRCSYRVVRKYWHVLRLRARADAGAALAA